ncbi:hypothetical protein BD779DRAFT_1500310 [Infundibulicybe gibba]|nr:hypothetical protein BD779DRAFT_1500310 [Infundibulicybe gibba]
MQVQSSDSEIEVESMHDTEYYMEDGSCILLVQDTLFNVHRSKLSKDNSSFGAMFTFPKNPIVLLGDTPSEFRNFLWVLYALPHELRIVNSPSADLVQLMDIARISNKYSFKSIETWALDAIQDYVSLKPSPILSPHSSAITAPNTVTVAPQPLNPTMGDSRQLTRLIRLAQLCGHEQLLNTMIGLLTGLMTSSLQYAYLAMSLADELGLRALRGAAYLEVMQKDVIARRTRSERPPQEGGDIDEKGRLVHASSCGATWHQHGCTQSWLEFWKDKTRDILGRLQQVQKDYDRWGSATYMHPECKTLARKGIVELMKKIEDELPDYFCELGDDD